MHPDKRAAIIKECKDTITYRAFGMGLRYEKSDILVSDCGNGNECVFLKYYFLEPSIDSKGGFVRDKEGKIILSRVPNIWAKLPSPGLQENKTQFKDGMWVTTFLIPKITVHVRMPQLVFLVFADGTIKDGAVADRSILFDFKIKNNLIA